MIYTFYSYKGGVGRSMAMANVAEWFYEQGLRVIIIDWDLEAPGLENFFYKSDKEIDAVRCQLGLIDMLMAYKRIFPRLRVSEIKEDGDPPENRESEQSSSEQKLPTDWLQLLRDNLPPVSDTMYPIHAPDASDDSKGALWIISAGWRSGDRFPIYAEAVQSFNWSDFYAAYEGEYYFEWLREQLVAEDLADVVLIDSRTGVTEMGGVCTRQMADLVVSFCVPNSQNLAGVYTMAKSFNRDDILEKRKRNLEMVIVPSRLDISEVEDRKLFEDQFRERLDEFTPAAFKSVDRSFWDLQIQYVPKYAYREGLAIRDPRVPELQKAYKKITTHLALLAQGASGERVRAKCADELQREFASHLPGLYQLTEEERDRFVQLAFFPEDAAISVRDAQRLWEVDDAAAERLIQRLAGISLLAYEPEQKILRLNTVVRAKLLEQMPDQKALNDKIETAFAGLSLQDQMAARPIFTRLVRLVARDEEGDDTRQRVDLSEWDSRSRSVIEALAEVRLVTIEKESAGGSSVQIANEAYINAWERLRVWIEDDRKFLLWRQQLKFKIAEWEETGRDQGALLSGVTLDTASEWRRERRKELNQAEDVFIDESLREADRLRENQRQALLAQETALRTKRRARVAAALVLLLIVVVTALAIWERSRLQKAEAQRRQELEIENNRRVLAESYNITGTQELNDRDYDSALDSFSSAIKVKSDYVEAYLNRARAHTGKGDRDSAIADYGQSLKLKSDPVAYFERADLYAEKDDFNSALADYNSAIKLKPDYWNAYLNRGYLYENAKSFEPAVADYTQIINSRSKEFKANAYLRRGFTYLSMQDKESAKGDFGKALELTADPAVTDPANRELKMLSAKPVPENQAPAALIVFLQYSDAKDGSIVDAISASLRKNEFDVQPKELISRETKGDVRYYSDSPDVKASVEKIRKIVAQTIADRSKVNLDMLPIYLGKRFPYVPRGNIEVWIPPLQKSVRPLLQSVQQPQQSVPQK